MCATKHAPGEPTKTAVTQFSSMAILALSGRAGELPPQTDSIPRMRATASSMLIWPAKLMRTFTPWLVSS